MKRPNPKSVAIVGMGNSCKTYVLHCAQRGSYKKSFDETWAINAMGGVIQHDRALIMDDIEEILKPLIQANPTCMTAGVMDWLPVHPGPVYTTTVWPGYPGLVEFPLEEVIRCTGAQYLNTTVAYAVALAMSIGFDPEKGVGSVKRIALYGCDFTYPNSHVAESGRGCVEFLLGVAFARGISIELPEDTTLMDSNVPQGKKFYGWNQPVRMDYGDGKKPPVLVKGNGNDVRTKRDDNDNHGGRRDGDDVQRQTVHGPDSVDHVRKRIDTGNDCGLHNHDGILTADGVVGIEQGRNGQGGEIPASVGAIGNSDRNLGAQ